MDDVVTDIKNGALHLSRVVVDTSTTTKVLLQFVVPVRTHTQHTGFGGTTTTSILYRRAPTNHGSFLMLPDVRAVEYRYEGYHPEEASRAPDAGHAELPISNFEQPECQKSC